MKITTTQLIGSLALICYFRAVKATDYDVAVSFPRASDKAAPCTEREDDLLNVIVAKTLSEEGFAGLAKCRGWVTMDPTDHQTFYPRGEVNLAPGERRRLDCAGDECLDMCLLGAVFWCSCCPSTCGCQGGKIRRRLRGLQEKSLPIVRDEIRVRLQDLVEAEPEITCVDKRQPNIYFEEYIPHLVWKRPEPALASP